MHIFNMKWMETVKTNSIKAWLLAARPKTLAGAAVPVMLGCALAAADGWFQIVHRCGSRYGERRSGHGR